MKHKEFIRRVKASPNKEMHKKAFVSLVALHTGNKPDAIETSLKNKDGFAAKKINEIHPAIRSQIFQSALTHGNLMKGKK